MNLRISKGGNNMRWLAEYFTLLLMATAALLPVCASAEEKCISGVRSNGDLEVCNGGFQINGGKHIYRFVNVHSDGFLLFADADTDFWAKSILIEKSGTLQIGTQTSSIKSSITIHLYGSSQDTDAITCKTPNTNDTHCGIDINTWNDQDDHKDLPGNIKDHFYSYSRLVTDDNLPEDAYFGRKVLAVSYGGKLQMFGAKGADGKGVESGSGNSWVRLDKGQNDDQKTLTLERPVDWVKGDRIVVTTTDYLPGHSEEREISGISKDGKTIALTTPLLYKHNRENFKLDDGAVKVITSPDGDSRNSIETRAAVALLSRNIRIVSNLTTDDKDGLFPLNSGSEDAYFGGHIIVRQGFEQFQMQGVELYQMGQGGRMAHVPINFYLTRKTPAETYVKDCSIWDSMNHWIELRGTQGVLLQRNVGYKSIGHGFVLADGTETDNTLIANIGIYARPGVEYADNTRKVPGVLATTTLKNDDKGKPFLFSTSLSLGGDAFHPSPFFIMNGYNTVNDNMAAGAGACGSCYWFAPAKVSAFSTGKSWEDMAGIQQGTPGTAPIKSFKGNFCTTAMYSLVTVGDVGVCGGFAEYPTAKSNAWLKPVENKHSATYAGGGIGDVRYANPDEEVSGRLAPVIATGAFLQPATAPGCNKDNTDNCAVNVIDSYTSSFHWAEKNFSAIWLRLNWFLFTDGALTDVQNGGLSMISGGSYDQVPTGYWGLTRRSVFVGKTQDRNPFATEAGPQLNSQTGLNCAEGSPPAYCLLEKEGISFNTDVFNNYQRFINIYDGPVYLDSNAFLNIRKTVLKGSDCVPGTGNGESACSSTELIYGSKRGIPIPVDQDEPKNLRQCILPNAAIGWKQPNGFYYPPAFHMANLYFKDVDIRHYVIVPPFSEGTMNVDPVKLEEKYCSFKNDSFSGSWTDIDRQTEINDDDGSLSGIVSSDKTVFEGSISVNNDEFFKTPKQVFECLSQESCLQVPNDHLNIAVIPTCADGTVMPCKVKCNESGYKDYNGRDRGEQIANCEKANCICDSRKWAAACETKDCAGVAIYRQLLLDKVKIDGIEKSPEPVGPRQGIRMMGAGISQRSVMIANNGVYFIDTTRRDACDLPSFFEPGRKYTFFTLYAKPNTKVTFQLFVGKGIDDIRHVVNKIRMNSKTLIPSDSEPYECNNCYDKEQGILTVTLDLSKYKNSAFSPANFYKESCGPASYCTWNDSNNTCEAKICASKEKGACEAEKCTWSESSSTCSARISYADNTASNVCSSWAVKAPECPAGGCFGFQITFPGTFDSDITPYNASASPQDRPRPKPVEYSKSEHWKDNTWKRVLDKGGKECIYTNIP